MKEVLFLTVEDVEAAMVRVLAESPGGKSALGEGGEGTVPIWAQWRHVKGLFTGITRDRLNSWCHNGWVRKRCGDSAQHATEYCVADIDATYCKQAIGKKPAKVAK